MSELGTAVPPPVLREGFPLSSLTLLVLVLIPCVVLLLLLNCLLIGYKLFIFTKKKTERPRSDSTLLNSLLSTRQRITHFSNGPTFNRHKTNYVSVSEPALALPVTSSLTSSAERRATGQRGRFVRPDGATCRGSGSLRMPSTLLGAMSATASTSRADLPRSARTWWRSAPALVQSSDSETERVNMVPPNSPAHPAFHNGCEGLSRPRHRSSTVELACELSTLEKLHVECEVASSIPQEGSCIVTNSSAIGPGLDGDFGASAGVSLRIVSADSDGFPGSTWASGLEWDYYDPSYVAQNRIPKVRHHVPPLTTKQYWV